VSLRQQQRQLMQQKQQKQQLQLQEDSTGELSTQSRFQRMRLTVRQEQALRSAVNMAPATQSGAQDAALALREVVPGRLQTSGAVSSSGGETPDKVKAFSGHRAGLHHGSSYSPRSISSHGTCFQADVSGTGGTVNAPDNPFVPLVQRLLNDQSMLRESFEDTKRRLCLLEDTRHVTEGRGRPLSTREEAHSVDAEAHSLEKPWLPLQAHDSDATVSLAQLHTGQATSPAAAMSPASALAAAVRRSEEDRRSAELSGENELLRQELAEASVLSEALEQQQQAADDRMRLLEQEHAWLAERLAQLSTEPGSVSVPDSAFGIAASIPVTNPLTCSVSPQSVADAGEELRSDLPKADAVDRRDAKQGTVLSPDAQDVEHRLLEAEERAQQLELENARLLAATALQSSSTSVLLESADGLGPFSGLQLPPPASAEPDAVELTYDDPELDEVY